MNIVKAHNLSKVLSGGGQNFQPPLEWMTAAYGSGWPIQPVSVPQDTELPRVIDYPISVNSSLTPRTGWGIMPFAALKSAYENVTEAKMPINLIWREMTTFVPRLVDTNQNSVEDHPYQWMTRQPDRKTPFTTWLTRLLKSSKIYDAAAVYLQRSGNQTTGLHYIDGSTLFIIVDQFGNIPDADSVVDYMRGLPDEQRREFAERWEKYYRETGKQPEKIPAFTQVVKGTPFSWWSQDQVWYAPQSPRVDSPYGETFIEQAWDWLMLIVNVIAFELGHYRTGNMPEGFVTLPKDMYPTLDRITVAELAYNARMSSNPSTERMRLRMFPDGSKYFPTKKPDFPIALYTQAWRNILHTIGIPPSEFGDIPGQGLGGKGFKEGAASELSRNTLNPHKTFVEDLFNHVLEKDGVEDVIFDLSYPQEEIDPDKLKTSLYEGMARGAYTLNDVLGQLGMRSVGSPDDPGNMANKHLIIAGSSIYVLEDMEDPGGVAVPAAQPVNVPGGAPIGPEDALNPEQKPPDAKTFLAAIQNILQHNKLTSKTTSISAATAEVDPKELEMGLQEEQEHAETVDNDPATIRAIVLDHLKEDPHYYSHLAEAGLVDKVVMPEYVKHCGLCPEDDDYFGAPISREIAFPFFTNRHVNTVEVVAMCPPGLPPVPALWKPEGGELDVLQERIGGKLYPREEAAYLLDRSLGFRLVPVAYVAEAGGENGAALYYVLGNGKSLPAQQYAPEWVERAAVFDYVTGQTDRNTGNFLTHPDDAARPVLIDNALGFPAVEAEPYSPFVGAARGRELSAPTLARVKFTLGDAATWEDVRALVGDIAAQKAFALMQKLYDERMIRREATTVTEETGVSPIMEGTGKDA